ncbi:hypothetical protein QNH14_16225 [Apirhabdus apintestini]|nr:hypothetical protein QNH14_16225 [Enterobacteriaceae bacterium CA-0114]
MVTIKGDERINTQDAVKKGFAFHHVFSVTVPQPLSADHGHILTNFGVAAA